MNYDKHKILLDIPSPSPALGVQPTATAFKQLIENSDPRFAVGIFGGWGSGKTTLMHTIRGLLDPSRAVAVWFSAWRYEKEPHLVIPLLDTIRADLAAWAKLHEGDPWAERVRKTTLSLGIALRALLRGVSFKLGLPGAIEVGLDAGKALAAEQAELAAASPSPASPYFAAFSAMAEAFEAWGTAGAQANGGRRIVVFIDDLNRCFPNAALEVLESMKLFFDFPGFVFVVGLDRAVVQRAVEVKYAQGLAASGLQGAAEYRISGQEYIQKIFQIPYALAPVSITQLDELVAAVTQEANLEKEQAAQLKVQLLPHLRFLLKTPGVIPREVKRFINAFTLSMKIKPWLNPDVVLALQTVEFRPDWRAAIQPALLSYRRVFTKALVSELIGNSTALADLADDINVPEDFRRYAAAGGPGESLLACENLDEYIFSGEATRSFLSPAFFDLSQGSLTPPEWQATSDPYPQTNRWSWMSALSGRSCR